MRRDQAERLAAEIRQEESDLSTTVEHVPDGAPDPYGYVVRAHGALITSPASWAAMRREGELPNKYRYVLRLPPLVGMALADLADRHRRSINGEIEVALEEYVRREMGENP